MLNTCYIYQDCLMRASEKSDFKRYVVAPPMHGDLQQSSRQCRSLSAKLHTEAKSPLAVSKISSSTSRPYGFIIAGTADIVGTAGGTCSLHLTSTNHHNVSRGFEAKAQGP